MRGPARSNKTGIATAADVVMTPPEIASCVINHFKPAGLILEPAKGNGSFYDQLPHPKDWCEISEGRDFFDYDKKVDWIITNPPYSIYDRFLAHCLDLADNVVLLVPLVKALKSMGIIRLVESYGGLKEVFVIGSGGKCGFAVGLPTGCLYYRRDYRGSITLSKPKSKSLVYRRGVYS
jgi:hypothetical protein